MTTPLLIIDDDRELAAMLVEYLTPLGFEVDTRATAREGLTALKRGRYEALLLDVMLPDGDGFDVCRRVRAESDIPILMLTARGDAMARIVGLELGADDYLPKPFNPRELLARLRAVLRRRAPAGTPGGVHIFGRLEIDREQRVVRIDGEERPLTGYQFDLLAALADNAGRVMSRDALMDRVPGHLRPQHGRARVAHSCCHRRRSQTAPSIK